MKYVTCPKSTADKLLAKGDSVYAQTDKYSLENLGLDNEAYNEWLVALYGDTIPVLVSVYDTYHVITGYDGEDETNASFVWHEVAKTQITRFLQKGGHEVTREEIDKVFCVMDGILDYYSGGWQYELNMAAARRVLVADYHLLDAYKRLMDCFPSTEIRKLVHEDYKYLLDTCHKYMEYRYKRDRYSDLPREMGCMLHDLLMAKAASVNGLTAIKASRPMAVKNLREHICLENGKSFRLTCDILDDYSRDY